MSHKPSALNLTPASNHKGIIVIRQRKKNTTPEEKLKSKFHRRLNKCINVEQHQSIFSSIHDRDYDTSPTHHSFVQNFPLNIYNTRISR